MLNNGLIQTENQTNPIQYKQQQFYQTIEQKQQKEKKKKQH